MSQLTTGHQIFMHWELEKDAGGIAGRERKEPGEGGAAAGNCRPHGSMEGQGIDDEIAGGKGGQEDQVFDDQHPPA